MNTNTWTAEQKITAAAESIASFMNPLVKTGDYRAEDAWRCVNAVRVAVRRDASHAVAIYRTLFTVAYRNLDGITADGITGAAEAWRLLSVAEAALNDLDYQLAARW